MSLSESRSYIESRRLLVCTGVIGYILTRVKYVSGFRCDADVHVIIAMAYGWDFAVILGSVMALFGMV